MAALGERRQDIVNFFTIPISSYSVHDGRQVLLAGRAATDESGNFRSIIYRDERIRTLLVSNRRDRTVPRINDRVVRQCVQLCSYSVCQSVEAAAGEIAAADAATKQHVAAEDDNWLPSPLR